MNINEYPLRDRKYAKTKIAITKAFIERLKTTRFNDISIKEVCESVDVSEGTFFNYFPQKVDVVFYFKQIITLKLSYEFRTNAETMGFQKLIERIFDSVADEMDQPYVFYEMISLFTAERKKPLNIDLTPVEKFYAFPDYDGIEEIPVQSLEEIFLPLIEEALAKGEIKKGLKSKDILLTLMAILLGIPLAVDIEDFGRIKKHFHAQLSLFWQIIGVH